MIRTIDLPVSHQEGIALVMRRKLMILREGVGAKGFSTRTRLFSLPHRESRWRVPLTGTACPLALSAESRIDTPWGWFHRSGRTPTHNAAAFRNHNLQETNTREAATKSTLGKS